MTNKKNKKSKKPFAPDVLELAIDCANIGIWDYDIPSGQIVWSDRMYQILGLPTDMEVQIDTLGTVIHPDDRDFVFEKIDESIAEHVPYDLEYRAIRRDTKETIWTRAMGRTEYDENQTPVRMLGAAIDITENKKAEAKAQAADRAKSQFLANMSHEIRTPMNGVMGMAELLAATELTSKQQNFADVIVRSGNSLLTVINDILDFSKIDAGEMELHPEPFDLADAIEDVAILVSASAADKNLELVVRYDPNLPRSVVGDAGRIRQVISNLMSNAVKFTNEGHVLVDVSGVVKEDEQGRVSKLRVRIEDTGVGIPDGKIATIFDKFTQVDNTSTRTQEGTGLGLSISKSLIELMDGKIGLESTLGEGSEFWFEIELPIHGEVVKKVCPPVDVCGAHVLIIDDNAVNCEILKEMMASWKFDATSANSGTEGVDLLRAAPKFGKPFDAVILDYQMPIMNGVEVAKLIRSDANIGSVPIILLTSVDHVEVDIIDAGLFLEAQLVKPAKSSLLLETLVHALQNGHNLDRVAFDASAEGQKNVDLPKSEILFQQGESSNQKSIDILIAEDNEVNKIVFQQILNELDYSYEIVPNGKLAVELYEKQSPGIIIMDVSMPEMNGLDATRAIRAMEADNNQSVPIIGVTAHAMSGDMEKCIDAGMDDYLPKPISPKRLIEKIEKWIGAQRESNVA